MKSVVYNDQNVVYKKYLLFMQYIYITLVPYILFITI